MEELRFWSGQAEDMAYVEPSTYWVTKPMLSRLGGANFEQLQS
jgi:hypothetical protein